MTKETDISIKEKEILRDCLKDLCQHNYLPYTTKQYNSPEDIVERFLEFLNT